MGKVYLFAKLPQRGRVKTRLAAEIGEVAALAWYEAMLLDLLTQLGPQPAGRPLTLSLDRPGDPTDLFRAWGHSVPLHIQREGDLGQRLASANQEARDDIVLLGADCPWVDGGLVASAFDALGVHDTTIGPCEDGGYYLVGMRKSVDAMAWLGQGIRWSDPHTLDDTLSRARALGLTTGQLPSSFDIDTKADLDLLIDRLKSDATVRNRLPRCDKLAHQAPRSSLI